MFSSTWIMTWPSMGSTVCPKWSWWWNTSITWICAQRSGHYWPEPAKRALSITLPSAAPAIVASPMSHPPRGQGPHISILLTRCCRRLTVSLSDQGNASTTRVPASPRAWSRSKSQKMKVTQNQLSESLTILLLFRSNKYMTLFWYYRIVSIVNLRCGIQASWFYLPL